MSDEGFSNLVIGFDNYTNIERLNLAFNNNNLTKNGLLALSDKIAKLTPLIELNLDFANNSIFSDSLESLDRALSKLPNL